MPWSHAEWPSTPRSDSRRPVAWLVRANAAAAVAQVPTAINPVASQTAPTRQFVAASAQSPPARRGFGCTQWLLAGAAVGVFAAVVGLVLWLVLGQNRTRQVVVPPSPSQATTASETPTT